MTVILMLTVFAIFIAIEYLRKGKAAAQASEMEEEMVPVVPRPKPSYVAGFDLPDNRRYHQGHTWALQESPTLVRVGIDDFGARLVGKLDSIALPKRGQWIRQGQKFATLIRDGEKTDLVSPVEGEVTNVNEALLSDPALPNSDPYGQGWFVSVVAPDLATSFRNLLGGTLARKWMAEAAHRLQSYIPAVAGAVAQDGGVAVHDLTVQIASEKWAELASEFFLT